MFLNFRQIEGMGHRINVQRYLRTFRTGVLPKGGLSPTTTYLTNPNLFSTSRTRGGPPYRGLSDMDETIGVDLNSDRTLLVHTPPGTTVTFNHKRFTPFVSPW